MGVFDTVTGDFTSVGSAWGTGIYVDGRRGEHVPFYGSSSAVVGATYINDWIVRGTERWQVGAPAWRVQMVDAERASAELLYDAKSGVLVGGRFNGVGYKVSEKLVFARDVNGVQRCPGPSMDFGSKPLDWMGD